MEQDVVQACRRTLVVRTNAYGWSPLPQAPGLVETVLAQLSADATCTLDYVRHGTPILATDLAEILEQAYAKRLSGLYHIAGAERVSPYRFGALLARRLGYDHLSNPNVPVREATEAQFGCGETSLQCLKIRRELGVALPLLRDGVDRLCAQSDGGFRDQFGPCTPPVRNMVA
jgi:dTDP-4-dehydrorhamnose reductase